MLGCAAIFGGFCSVVGGLSVVEFRNSITIPAAMRGVGLVLVGIGAADGGLGTIKGAHIAKERIVATGTMDQRHTRLPPLTFQNFFDNLEAAADVSLQGCESMITILIDVLAGVATLPLPERPALALGGLLVFVPTPLRITNDAQASSAM